MSACATCGATAEFHPQCRFAMAKLCARLIEEDYVRPERRVELRNRALNLERGLGFLTDHELKINQQEEDLLS